MRCVTAGMGVAQVGMLLRVIGVRYIVSVRQVIRRDREDAINTSDET